MKKSKYLPSDAKGRPANPSMGTTNHDCGGVGIDGGARRERPGEQSKHFDIFERERQSNRARERDSGFEKRRWRLSGTELYLSRRRNPNESTVHFLKQDTVGEAWSPAQNRDSRLEIVRLVHVSRPNWSNLCFSTFFTNFCTLIGRMFAFPCFCRGAQTRKWRFRKSKFRNNFPATKNDAPATL